MILMSRQEPTFIYFFHKVLQQMGYTEVVYGVPHLIFTYHSCKVTNKRRNYLVQCIKIGKMETPLCGYKL